MALRSTSLLSGNCNRRSSKRVAFDADVIAEDEEKADAGSFHHISVGRSVVLEPSHGAGQLSRLRGVEGLVTGVTMDQGEMSYSISLNSSSEIVQMPACWVRLKGILFDTPDVEFLSIEDVFKAACQYRVPVFQRRYCWGEAEWTELWESVVEAGKDGPNAKQTDRMHCHSLGRVLLFGNPDGSMLVIDGQQRLTTCSLLFAALRDRFLALGQTEDAACLTRLVTVDGVAYRLLPTLNDREDYQSCMTEIAPTGESSLLECKRLFARLSSMLDAGQCKAFAESARQRLFSLRVVLPHLDSLQSVFENLTEQERKGPGVDLQPIDLVRNFVLEHFNGEQHMIQAYEEYWSPMELKAGGPEQLSCAFCSHFSCRTSDLCGFFIEWWRQGETFVSEEGAEQRLQELIKMISTSDTSPSPPSSKSSANPATASALRQRGSCNSKLRARGICFADGNTLADE